MLLWTNHLTEQHYPLIDQIKAQGYEGIEIPLGQGNEHHYTALGKHLTDMGLKATAVTSLDVDTNVASPDPKIRQAGLDRLKWAIDMAKAAQAELICGPFHSAFAYFTRKPATNDERKWSVEMLRKAAEYAEQANVRLAPEAINRFECYLCNTMADLKWIVEEVNHPHLGAIYDSHHAHIEEKSQKKAIESIAPHLIHVHISENDRGTPGAGQVHWDEVFSTLLAINYQGWLTIEAFSTTIPEFAYAINVWRNFSTSDDIFKEGIKFIRHQLSTLAQP